MGNPDRITVAAQQLRELAAKPGSTAYLFLLAGALSVFAPTVYDLATQVWNTEEQGHAPIVVAVALWLAYRSWPAMLAARGAPSRWGWLLMALVVPMYALGRSQQIYLLEVGALIPLLASVVLVLLGPAALRKQWFALFFMLFMIPLPSTIVETLTMPMKMGVSYAAEGLLHLFGYPMGRSGVILYIGQYQLLVADACAGLHTLFTLEALGLLYLNLVRRDSLWRNAILATLIVPISFGANTIRVVLLSLITYHFGDAAGQGFLHGFAGMVLFLSALALIISVDTLLHWLLGVHRSARAGREGPAHG
jgi:exosortase B